MEDQSVPAPVLSRTLVAMTADEIEHQEKAMIPKPGISKSRSTDRSSPEHQGAEDAVERVEDNFRTRR